MDELAGEGPRPPAGRGGCFANSNHPLGFSVGGVFEIIKGGRVGIPAKGIS